MRSRMRLVIVALSSVLVLLSIANSKADAETGSLGIGLAASESSSTFLVRVWTSPKFTIEPTLALLRFSPKIGDSQTRLAPGLGLIYHGRQGESMRPLVGVRFELDMLITDGSDLMDVHLAPVFGGEYFFSKSFSVSGEYQFVFIFTDDSVSPDISLRANSTYLLSSQLLSVNFYF